MLMTNYKILLVDDDRDVFVALARVTPDMLVDTDGAHAVETVRVID